MQKLISECPACGSKLRITSLHCAGCGMELRNDFALSPFDLLNAEQMRFLCAFLRQRGNMSSVQSELGISYPTAKKKLDDLLTALNLLEDNRQDTKTVEDKRGVDMITWHVQENSTKASDIIKRKLIENNGRVIVHTARGFPAKSVLLRMAYLFSVISSQSIRHIGWKCLILLLIFSFHKGDGRKKGMGETINLVNLSVMKQRSLVSLAIGMHMLRAGNPSMTRCLYWQPYLRGLALPIMSVVNWF